MNVTKIEWKSSYEIGVEEIDLQHHYFIDLINRLAKMLGKGARIEYQMSLIKELNAYAKFHFISEENLMEYANYPDLNEHKTHHYQLIDKLSSKQNNLLNNPSEEEVRNLISFLVEWFFQHTNGEDKRFAEFLHKTKNN